MNATRKKSSEEGSGTVLKEAMGACRASFMSAAFFSLFVNLLMLLPTVYMLQVYDRVLSSGSESTLLMLTLIMVFLFIVLGGLEWLRAQMLIVASMERGRDARSAARRQPARGQGQSEDSGPSAQHRGDRIDGHVAAPARALVRGA
jgi:ABC-type protease/lipase transport system fused ATPase/permease subunit